jgi:hypothetical protein
MALKKTMDPNFTKVVSMTWNRRLPSVPRVTSAAGTMTHLSSGGGAAVTAGALSAAVASERPLA